MKLRVEQYGLRIIPETEQDMAYMHDTLNIHAGDQDSPIKAYVITAIGGGIGWLTVPKQVVSDDK